MKLNRLVALVASVVVGNCAVFGSEIFSADEVANSFGIKDLDVAPAPISQQAPSFSEDLKDVSGKVYVAFIVDTEGNVDGVRCIKSTAEVLNDSVIEAVSNWKFTAGERKGQSVAVRVVVPVRINV